VGAAYLAAAEVALAEKVFCREANLKCEEGQKAKRWLLMSQIGRIARPFKVALLSI
jgi:hypothetical protein